MREEGSIAAHKNPEQDEMSDAHTNVPLLGRQGVRTTKGAGCRGLLGLVRTKKQTRRTPLPTHGAPVYLRPRQYICMVRCQAGSSTTSRRTRC